MSANLDLVRSVLSGWERGDFAATAWAHPDIEFVVADGPDPFRAVGVADVSRTWREFLAAWTDHSISAEEYRELDGDRVYVGLNAHGRGKASGAEITSGRGANVFHVREGRVARLAIYFDHRRALADLGVEEEPDPGPNAAIVRAAFEAFWRGDVAAMLARAAPDILSTQFPDQLDAEEFRGPDGLLRMMSAWLGMWDEWTIELLDISEAPGVVFASAVQRGRGKGSGAPMENYVTFAFEFRDGLIASWRIFHDEQEARRATGVAGGGPH